VSRAGRGAVAVGAWMLCALAVRETASSPTAQEPAVAYGVGEGAAAKLSTGPCASCHGDDLRGGRASSLLDETWVFGGSDADLAASIRDGRPGTLMPPFKGRARRAADPLARRPRP
jgi:mono/diheme cytochrome c family protein